MTGMEIALQHVKKARARLTKSTALIKKLGDAPWEYRSGPDAWYLWMDTEGTITARAPSLAGLHEVRAFLREKLGQWDDRCTSVFGNLGNGVTAVFSSKRYPSLSVILVTSVEDFPRELLPSETCEIVESEEMRKTVEVRCNL